MLHRNQKTIEIILDILIFIAQYISGLKFRCMQILDIVKNDEKIILKFCVFERRGILIL